MSGYPSISPSIGHFLSSRSDSLLDWVSDPELGSKVLHKIKEEDHEVDKRGWEYVVEADWGW